MTVERYLKVDNRNNRTRLCKGQLHLGPAGYYVAGLQWKVEGLEHKEFKLC